MPSCIHLLSGLKKGLLKLTSRSWTAVIKSRYFYTKQSRKILSVRSIQFESKPSINNLLVLKSSSMHILFKSIWKPIKVSFVKVIDKMEEAAEDVRLEADLAEKQEASEARKKADIQTRCKKILASAGPNSHASGTSFRLMLSQMKGTRPSLIGWTL
jgi:hypothetical protein